MKKHLIAAAVAAAVAVPAAAQVTVYGVMDASYSSTSKTTVGSLQEVATSQWATSRLGFRGNEDLGGGLKAGFVFETELLNDRAYAATSGPTWGGRGFELTLSGGFGALGIGKSANSDANIVASGFFANMSNFSTGTASRPANRIQYSTPTFSGIQANVAFSPNAADAVEGITAATKKTGEYTSAGVSFVQGPLSARAFVAEQDTVVSATASNSGNLETKDQGLLIRYNLGVADIGIRYMKTKVTTGAGTTTTDRKSMAADAAIPLGQSMRLIASYVNLDEAAANNDTTRTIIGLDYGLSKRTSLYTFYAKANNDSGVKLAAIGKSGIAGGANGDDPSVFAVGVRHSF